MKQLQRLQLAAIDAAMLTVLARDRHELGQFGVSVDYLPDGLLCVYRGDGLFETSETYTRARLEPQLREAIDRHERAADPYLVHQFCLSAEE